MVVWEDFLCHVLCHPCSMCQELRELKLRQPHQVCRVHAASRWLLLLMGALTQVTVAPLPTPEEQEELEAEKEAAAEIKLEALRQQVRCWLELSPWIRTLAGASQWAVAVSDARKSCGSTSATTSAASAAASVSDKALVVRPVGFMVPLDSRELSF